jgi:3-hydroxymyristoyl/3-hydroxydecanoyl-(acyl carrier protein) dehydratase
MPIIATLSLFYAVGRWNAYADNKYYITKEGLKMIQYKLYQLVASATEAQTATLSEAIEVTSTPEVLQSACIMFADRMKKKGTTPVYTGLDKVRFRGMIKPGDTIRIDTKILKQSHPMYMLHGELSVDGKRCMSGDFSFAILEEKERN